ncbi:probable cytochrome P450 6a21 [Cephus cinctus]|uniref:Probable cytochrome P450 6a21 n=1 Tax=Cephus cinctus TaxID=211228 RepID=A0AAJ7RKQ9_CEPCN|nr:probable cytochrome P450 6a21 [Cephus cinctus]
MAALEILCSVAVVFILFYYYVTRNYNFWKQRHVAGPEPMFPFGNFKEITFGQLPIGILIKQYYDQFKGEPMVGIFVRSLPTLIVRDPELVKDVLIKDFTSFPNRGIHYNTKVDPLSENLFMLKETKWRPLRRKLTPVFTSGKLKQMFYLLLECGDVFEKYLDHLSEKNEPIECRDITAKFTTEVIGTCAFGLKTDAIADDNSEFRKMGIRVFSTSFMKTLQFILRQSMPWLYNILGKCMADWVVIDFFTKSIKDIIEHRKQNNIVRHDFIDLLVDMKEYSDNMSNVGAFSHVFISEIKSNIICFILYFNLIDFLDVADNLIAAQAFIFFAAGFETSSTTMSNALYELALNQDMQDKLRQEIKEEIMKNNGELTYEAVKDMKYLHMVFQGARFAVYQTKVGLIKVLINHKVDVCEKTKIPYEFNTRAFILSPKDGIYLKFSKLSA